MDTNEKPNVCCISTPSRMWGTARGTSYETSDKSWAAELAASDAVRNLQ